MLNSEETYRCGIFYFYGNWKCEQKLVRHNTRALDRGTEGPRVGPYGVGQVDHSELGPIPE
jgi:hypothetical protein